MQKVSLIFPYIGNLNQYHLYAINQLNKIDDVDVFFITDNKNIKSEYIKSHNILNIENIFNHNNILNIKLEDIIRKPYKLCDYKPFLNLLFNLPTYDYWGFGDLDCIYNPAILTDRIKNLNNPNAVYGERGHFTILGRKSSEIIQNEFFKVIADFKKKGTDLLNPNINYALDEFKFFHIICNELNKKNKITWESNYFEPLLDIDYQHIIPINFNKEKKYEFDLYSIYVNNQLSSLSYIHLQKRKIQSKHNIFVGKNYLHFSPETGNALFQSEITDFNAPPKLRNRIIYFLTMFYKRVKYRIKNHGLNKRPSL